MGKRKMKYIAIGPNCWGAADTVEEAWKNCKENWPSWLHGGRHATFKDAKFYHVPVSIYVNDWGGLSGPTKDHELIKEVRVVRELRAYPL